MAKPRYAFVNRQIVPIEQARISVLDRGFLFADGIYEVVAVLDGQLVDFDSHITRLERSAEKIALALDFRREMFRDAMRELIQREALDEGMVYLQVSRGADSVRQFGFPDCDTVQPTVVMFCQQISLRNHPLAATGARAISVPEIRWRRRDIKSTALLPQVLGKQCASEASAFEAWMIEDGHVTEGTSSSASIITREGVIVTRPVTEAILDSITRRAMVHLADQLSLEIEERRFTLAEACAAQEALIASATALIMPIVEIDGHKIGDGSPGQLTSRLRQLYLELATTGCVADGNTGPF